MEQHHRTGLDLRHEHVSGGCGVGVVDPVEGDDVPEDSGQAVAGGDFIDAGIGETAGRSPQHGGVPGGGGDGVLRLGQLGGHIRGRNRRHIGVFPGVIADLHTGIGDPFGAVRVRRDFIADQEEGGLGAGVAQDAQQPVGIGRRPVVERERDALVDRAVDGTLRGGASGGGASRHEQCRKCGRQESRHGLEFTAARRG